MSMFDSPPKAPDPYQGMMMGAQTAGTQQTLNQQTGEAAQAGSMVNQVNPYGHMAYSQTGTGPNGVPLYTATTTLNPTQQALFDTLMGTKSTAGQGANALMSGANYGATNPTDWIGDFTKGTTKDFMDTQMEYYQPFFTTSRDQLDTRLRNQGVYPGNPVYDNAMRSLDTSQGMTVAKAAGEFQPKAFEQAKYLYNLPAMLGTSLAQFAAPGDPKAGLIDTPDLNFQPANYIGAAQGMTQALQQQYENELKAYQAKQGGMWGIPTAIAGGWGKAGFPGLGSLGSLLGGSAAAGAGAAGAEAGAMAGAEALGSALLLSDERTKENVSEVGALHDGQPIYSYNYIGDRTPRIGLMAQDVEKVRPDAVHEVDGVKMVDYDAATEDSRTMQSLFGAIP